MVDALGLISGYLPFSEAQKTVPPGSPKGLTEGSLVVKGADMKDGRMQWDSDPDPDFIIDAKDPRVARSLAVAEGLREKWKNFPEPEREARIARALTAQIEKEFGKYNPAVTNLAYEEDRVSALAPSSTKEKELSRLEIVRRQIDEKSLHSDWDRKDGANVASLGEFQKGQLICRHRGAVMSYLLNAAGVENRMVIGNVTWEGDKKSGYHLWVISEHTGGVFEACSSPQESYGRNVSSTSAQQTLQGASSIVKFNDGSYSVYGTGFVGTAGQKALLEQRRTGHLEKTFGAGIITLEMQAAYDTAQIELYKKGGTPNVGIGPQETPPVNGTTQDAPASPTNQTQQDSASNALAPGALPKQLQGGSNFTLMAGAAVMGIAGGALVGGEDNRMAGALIGAVAMIVIVSALSSSKDTPPQPEVSPQGQTLQNAPAAPAVAAPLRGRMADVGSGQGFDHLLATCRDAAQGLSKYVTDFGQNVASPGDLAPASGRAAAPQRQTAERE